MMAEKDQTPDGKALVAQMMGEQAPDPAPQQQAARPDPLVNELTGDDPANANTPAEAGDDGGLNGTGQNEPELPEGIIEKLRKAQHDAGKAGYQLGQERKEKAELQTQVEQLQEQVQALLAGRQLGAQQPQEEYTEPTVTSPPPEAVDAFMSKLDREWESKKDDPYMRAAADYAAAMVAEGLRQMRSEIGQVMGGVQDMQFNQRLERLGIDRTYFDAVRKDPAFSWGDELSDDKFLSALESQARIGGGRPSVNAPGQQNPSAGAPAGASRVDPRTMIEQTQNPGSVQNPRRLSQMKMEQALADKDYKAARAEATNLFSIFTGQ